MTAPWRARCKRIGPPLFFYKNTREKENCSSAAFQEDFRLVL